MCAEEIYFSLLNELQQNDRWSDGSNIMKYIENEIFFHEDYLPQSCYVRYKDIFNRYLENLSESELNNVYLCARRDYLPKSNDELRCLQALFNYSDLAFKLVENSSEAVFCQFGSFLSDICKNTPQVHYYVGGSHGRFIHYSEEDVNMRFLNKGIILSSTLSLETSFSSSLSLKKGVHYIGFSRNYQGKNFWCGRTRESIKRKKIEHEKKLENYSITFYQYEEYVLEVAEFKEEPINGPRCIHFVDVLSAKEYLVPFEYVDSFIPALYSNNHLFKSANDRWGIAWEELRTISEKLSSNESKYAAAWETDYLGRRLRSYLEGLKVMGILDDRYQAEKQSTMLAIAAAISYRLNLFKYKKDILDKPVMPTIDYENFIKSTKKSEWKPGRFLPMQPALSVIYLWSFWSKIFFIHRSDVPSESAEKYIRTRIFDNGFSLKMKKQILSRMQYIEENNRDVFPEINFPKIEI